MTTVTPVQSRATWYRRSAVDAAECHGSRVDAHVRRSAPRSAVTFQPAASGTATALRHRHSTDRRARRRVHQMIVVVLEVGAQVLLGGHLTDNMVRAL